MTGAASPRQVKSRGGAPWLAPLLVVAVGAIGIGVGFAVVSDDDNVTPAVQLTNLQEACQRWMGDRIGSKPPEGWCAAMTKWMYEQGSARQATGAMMAGDAERLRDTCRLWAIADPSSAGNADDTTRWCDDMVTWMEQHMSDWGAWMMNDAWHR